MSTDHYGDAVRNAEARAALQAQAAEDRSGDAARRLATGALSAGYAANAEAREAAARVDRSQEGDTFRGHADAVEARLGHPSASSAALRLRGAYADSDNARRQGEATRSDD